MSTLQLSSETVRCWWCGHKLTQESHRVHFELSGKPYDTVVCSPEHERAVTDAYRYVQRSFPVFWIGMAVSSSLFILSGFVRAATWCVLAAVFSLGLTMLLCPFTTPQTVELLGLKRSFLIGRIAGATFLLVVLGLAIALFVR